MNKLRDECKFILDSFVIPITELTKEDRDVVLQLFRRLSFVYNSTPLNYIIIFKKDMSDRCNGKKKHRNKLAALLVDIPPERFLEVREQLLTAMKDGAFQ